jgi:hypothetical protein
VYLIVDVVILFEDTGELRILRLESMNCIELAGEFFAEGMRGV